MLVPLGRRNGPRERKRVFFNVMFF